MHGVQRKFIRRLDRPSLAADAQTRLPIVIVIVVEVLGGKRRSAERIDLMLSVLDQPRRDQRIVINRSILHADDVNAFERRRVPQQHRAAFIFHYDIIAACHGGTSSNHNCIVRGQARHRIIAFALQYQMRAAVDEVNVIISRTAVYRRIGFVIRLNEIVAVAERRVFV